MALLSEQAPGSIVKIKENGVLVDFYVGTQDYESELNGPGKTLLIRKDALERRPSVTNTFINSPDSIWLNDTYKNYLSDDIKKYVTDTKIKCLDTESTLTTYVVSVFLLSSAEVFSGTDGSLLPIAGILKHCKFNGRDEKWWLRTIYNYGAKYRYLVNDSGNLDFGFWNTASTAPFIRPVFCLPGSFYVDESGNVIANQPPTVPTNFSVPSTIFSEYDTPISWGASTDPEGALAGYILERKLNGGEWAELYRGSALKYNDKTVPFGSSTVQYRVCAYDTENLQSDYAESAVVTVTNNRPPVVTGSNADLGTLTTTPPSITYTATDPDPGDTIAVTITLDETQLESKTVVSGEEQSFSVPADKWLEVLNGAHTLTVTAADQQGANGTREWTMTKAVTQIAVQVKDPVQTEEMCRRAVLDMTYALPEGAEIKVEMCNNALDDSPAWEDMTSAFLNGEKFFFQNQTKTAANWAYSWRITLNRNGQTGECWLFGGTGACD